MGSLVLSSSEFRASSLLIRAVGGQAGLPTEDQREKVLKATQSFWQSWDQNLQILMPSWDPLPHPEVRRSLLGAHPAEQRMRFGEATLWRDFLVARVRVQVTPLAHDGFPPLS